MRPSELFAHWGSVRRGLFEALEMLEPDHLDFSPREGLWTVREVVVHMANAEDSWMRLAMAGGMQEWPAGRFVVEDYVSVGSLIRLLTDVHVHTVEWLQTLSLDDLEARIPLPWGPEVTVGWVIWHVLEHEIHHRGEIYLMLGLLRMEAPDV